MASLSARLVLVVVLGAVCVSLMPAGRAAADPSLASRRMQAEALIETIRALDEDVGAAAERLNGARLELRDVRVKATTAEAELERSEALLLRARSRVAARLRQLYVEGGFGSVEEVILGARSLSEVLDRFELVQRVARHDARLVAEAAVLKKQAAARLAEVAVVQERQTLVVRELARERQSVVDALTSRAKVLSSLQSEIARLEAEERAHQARLRRGVADAVSAMPANDIGSRVAAIAMRYLGVAYKWGSASPADGLDCSGLVLRAYAELGVELPHFAAAQYELGRRVDRLELEPGDLVFFHDLEHVGIYIGNEYFIHAPRTGDVVKIALLTDPYYVRQWVGARRVI